jgi:hypothetical protein
LSLAHGGVEAALAGIHAGVPLESLAVPTTVPLTQSVGQLDVVLEEGPEQVDIRSCATVESSRQRPDVRAGTRCVLVSVTLGPEPQVLTWEETAGPP